MLVGPDDPPGPDVPPGPVDPVDPEVDEEVPVAVPLVCGWGELLVIGVGGGSGMGVGDSETVGAGR